MAMDILTELMSQREEYPKKQRILCEYLLEHYAQLGVMTVAELAEKAQVGTTTVMRLMQGLGYDNFGVFKRAFHDVAMKNSSSYQQLKESFLQKEETVLHRVVEDGISVLSQLETPSNQQQFQQALTLLLGARRIFTFGKRSSKAMALHFEYAVHCFYPEIYQLSHEADYIFDRIGLMVRPEDVFVLFSVWPSTKETVKVSEFCKNRGIPMILITNSHRNPNRTFASVILDTNSLHHESGAVATIAMIEALISEFGKRLAPVSTKNLEEIENILGEQQMILH